ncbi:Hsp70 family protein [Catenuloplanes japonicus]|uniref:Hsp70 family protein n=1 Tax=Catenuloplanes japonicus TaxID=33876 RepID=UPI00068F4A1B|nr:Hsp70 family protein [Catenuloplanes japonicus]
MTAYRLGIDFGTSTTIAVLSMPGRAAAPLLFDSSPLLSSAVAAGADGALLTGGDAERAAVPDPASFEANPKRRIDDGVVWLGDREVSTTDLIAAVLRRAGAEARRVAGGPPDEVVLTHPANWGRSRVDTLLEAAGKAGFTTVSTVAEPVAAAAYLTGVLERRVPDGRALIVYDLGAGTFDVSVVRRTAGGFEVLACDGLDDVGGLDLDAEVVGHARTRTGGATDEWGRLEWPRTSADSQARHQLWLAARAAKEQLSRHPSASLHVPLLGSDVLLTREEFEAAARGPLDRTVALTLRVLADSGIRREEVAGVVLVGGGSRVPLAASLLHRALRMPPIVTETPELVVAEGSLHTHAEPGPPQGAEPASTAPPAVPPAGSTTAPALPALATAGPALATTEPALATTGPPPPPAAPALPTLARVLGGLAVPALVLALVAAAAGLGGLASWATATVPLAVVFALFTTGAGGRPGRWALGVLVPLLVLRPAAYAQLTLEDPFFGLAGVIPGWRVWIYFGWDALAALAAVLAGVACARQRPLPGALRRLPLTAAVLALVAVLLRLHDGLRHPGGWAALPAPVAEWCALASIALVGAAVAVGLRRLSAAGRGLVATTAAVVVVAATAVAAQATDTYRSRAIAAGMQAMRVWFSPDGTVIAAAGRAEDGDDRLVRLWETGTGRLLATLRDGDTNNDVDVSFAPDGRTVATTSYQGGTRVWDVATGGQLAEFGGGATAVAVSPDGRALAIGSGRSVLLRDLSSGETNMLLEDEDAWLDNALAYHPGDGLLAVAARTEVRVVNPATGEVLPPFAGHTDQVYDVRFDTTGERMATDSGDGTARIWSWADRTTLATLRCPESRWVDAVALAPGGATAAYVCRVGTEVRLVSSAGDPLGVVDGHTASVYDVTFAPDGRTLASSSVDGTIRLWDLSRT